MEKKIYETPQVEVRELEGEVLLLDSSTGASNNPTTPTDPIAPTEANRNNVWEDLW